jgi:hypothetical protein
MFVKEVNEAPLARQRDRRENGRRLGNFEDNMLQEK